MSDPVDDYTTDVVTDDASMHHSRVPFVIMGVILILSLIAYGIVVFFMNKNKTGLFKDYTPPELAGGYLPYGEVKTFTPEEMANKQAVVDYAKAQLAANGGTFKALT